MFIECFCEVIQRRGLSLSSQRFQEIIEIWCFFRDDPLRAPLYTAVLHNVRFWTFSTSPVHQIRPRSQLSVVSFWKGSGEGSACQVAYFSFGVCELHEILEREGIPVVVAVPWLSTNIGSRQATLAAKKAWIQWSTAKRFENSNSFASIDLESWFWNKNLILLFPSSDDPFSWENLYLHSTAFEAASKHTKPMLKSIVSPIRWLSMIQA